MPATVELTVTTRVTEANQDCVGKATHDQGVIFIELDARRQDHRKALGLAANVKLHWSKETRTYEAQELSVFPWPIRYRVTTADAWYLGADGERVHYSPTIVGLDAHAGVAEVVKRTAVMLIVIGSIGYRRASWLLGELFRIETSKSTLSRWVKEVAAQLPSREEVVKRLDAQKPITEAHFDEIFPKGAKGPVLVVKDEHGRIITSERIEVRNEENVKKFLEWFKGLGLGVKTFFIDCCQVYRKVIPIVFKEAKVQLDYFHILQNVWRHMWKGFVRYRKGVAARAEKAGTPWYKARLKDLARCLWEHRYVIFKAEEELTPLDRDMLVGICEADQEVGKIRSFLCGVWRIFEDSKDEKEARKYLEALKVMEAAKGVKGRQEKAVKFLEETFEESTTYLRGEAPRRNSLAESGMRTLRRLEAEHDGFRTEDSRQDFLRIYQAIKYLGWSSQGPLPEAPAPGP